jgi:DNA-binding transcriptional MerR regulator
VEYSITNLAKISGVSSRTLRYYDQIDLLKPQRINSAGYRIYGAEQVDRLQQILYFKAFGLPLEEIRHLLDDPERDVHALLVAHYQRLAQERAALDHLLTTLAQTINYYEGEQTMSDKEKFTYFKQQKIADNEARYGEEIRAAYGEEVIEQSNQKWQNMSFETYQELEQTEKELFQVLAQLVAQQPFDVNSDLAKTAFDLHKKWLQFAAPFYTPDYHRNLGEMYVHDERFTAYYDQKAGQGAAVCLQAVINHYAE